MARSPLTRAGQYAPYSRLLHQPDNLLVVVYTPEQFRILREKGTETRGTGEYEHFKDEGVFNCAGCGTPLYKSTTKFDSGCGWPAFFDGM